ncbi:MAG: response regulator transcription factor [Leptothrix ochracea]|uniref:response regulator transcription factor n=1 Tax=Leptothrix ochracea TaxID=735331 RepID=UPI0034E1B54B
MAAAHARMGNATLTLVDRHEAQRASLARYFQASGFTVRQLASLEPSNEEGAVETTDVLLIALEQPLLPELNLLSSIKSKTTIGCIALTTRPAQQDRIAALDAGADMAFTKTIDRLELLAAVRALMRRLPLAPAARHHVHPPQSSSPVTLHHPSLDGMPTLETPAIPKMVGQHWSLNFASCTLISPAGSQSTALTSVEFDLLAILMASPLQTLSKAEILAVLGAPPEESSPSSVSERFHRVESALSRLRKKVQSAFGLALPVRAVFGEGLVFTAQARMD